MNDRGDLLFIEQNKVPNGLLSRKLARCARAPGPSTSHV